MMRMCDPEQMDPGGMMRTVMKKTDAGIALSHKEGESNMTRFIIH